MILRVIYRDTLLLNLVKISQWILNWLELVHQASFCPSKSSWSPSFTWNLRTSSNWISLLHPPQKYTWNPKNFLCICIMYTCFIQCSWSFCRFVQYSRRPPKRKNYVFQICVQYTYTYVHLYFFHGVNITDDLSNDIHHQVARYAAPTWNFYAAVHRLMILDGDLEAHLRHTGKKTHGNWCILLGWCDGPSISGKISMKNLDFSEKKTGWNTEMLRTKFAKTG